VVSVLNEARSTTLSSLNASQYGVKVDPTQVTLFKGSSYSVGAPDNVLNTLDSSVGIRNISLAGGATQVVFDRLTGRTGESGTFELYLINDPTSSSTISVSGSGIIEAN
ncbi:hypothetical protein KW807_00505, partial [Candidatus Parcubacteria bacterium]|nr:hypothetical protein [Candidatus Parcubacteria bacterium]